ncbi:1378_t:CDS:1, partial [Gigaspora margarita]
MELVLKKINKKIYPSSEIQRTKQKLGKEVRKVKKIENMTTRYKD